MSAPRLTKDQKNEICKIYASGVAIALIVERFGVDPSYPGLLAKRRGIARPADARYKRKAAA